jgi:uncharacterized phage-associated protein
METPMAEEEPFPPLIGFRSQKAAQVCAYFASSGGTVEKLKLIKLVYLAERQFIAEHGHPMLYDELFSLPHGPICSSALNGIDGKLKNHAWANFIVRRGNDVSAAKKFERGDFDQISKAELAVLEKIWARFKDMSASEIRKYTHENCPEYTEIERGRIPITYKELFKAVGEKYPDQAEDEILQYRKTEALLTV